MSKRAKRAKKTSLNAIIASAFRNPIIRANWEQDELKPNVLIEGAFATEYGFTTATLYPSTFEIEVERLELRDGEFAPISYKYAYFENAQDFIKGVKSALLKDGKWLKSGLEAQSLTFGRQGTKHNPSLSRRDKVLLGAHGLDVVLWAGLGYWLGSRK